VTDQQHRGGRDELSQTLRALREESGLSQSTASQKAGLTQSKLSRAENGLFLPTPEDVKALAKAYHASAPIRRRLEQLTIDLRAENIDSRVVLQRGAWHFQHRLGRIEQASAHIRSFTPTLVPGLLQTADYARAVFGALNEISGNDIRTAVTARMDRQGLLREPGRDFTMLIPEGMLGWSASTPVMVEQIAHMREVAQLDRVRLGIIPWGTPAPAFPTHGWDIYDERAVIVGTWTATALLTEPRDVTAYLALFHELEKLAVYDQEADETLARAADSYRTLGSSLARPAAHSR